MIPIGGGGTKPIKLFDTTIIHIDESSVLPAATDKTDKSYQEEFKAIAQKYDMKLRIVPLEELFACEEEGFSDDSFLSDDNSDEGMYLYIVSLRVLHKTGKPSETTTHSV